MTAAGRGWSGVASGEEREGTRSATAGCGRAPCKSGSAVAATLRSCRSSTLLLRPFLRLSPLWPGSRPGPLESKRNNSGTAVPSGTFGCGPFGGGARLLPWRAGIGQSPAATGPADGPLPQKGRPTMAAARHLLAIDQGTTSSRALVFDSGLGLVASAPARIRAAFPRLWLGRARAGGHLGERAGDLPGGDREGPGSRPPTSPPSASPTSARRRWSGTGRPAAPSTAPSSGRIAARRLPVPRSSAAGHEELIAARTGLRIDPYFSAPRSPGCSTMCPVRGGARKQANSPSARSTAFCSGA